MTKKDYLNQEGTFRITGTNKGQMCPFKPVPCQEDYCSQCPIYHDWRQLAEYIVICAWCGQVISREPNSGEPVVSHGICPECYAKQFGIGEDRSP